MFRRCVLVVLATTAAGCVSLPGDDVTVKAAEFDAAGAPWVGQVSGGCGMCGGRTGFGGGYAEHYALYVFGNDRVVLIQFNKDWNHEGPAHVDANVTYDHDELEGLLENSTRAGTREAWVVRVVTAQAEAGIAERLEDLWGPKATDHRCTDVGIDYAFRHGDGEVEAQSYTCGPEDGSMAQFAALIREVHSETAAQGHVEGMPPPR